MKQIKYLLIIITIVLVGCDRIQHKEPKRMYTGYILDQGRGRVIKIKIDSVTSLNNLIPKLTTNYELYPTYRGWYIGYNDLMYSIAIHGDSAINLLVDFYHQTKSYNAKIAALQTLHLIGINCQIEHEKQFESFSNLNARKALFQILSEDDSLQSKVMMLLSRRALASDIPLLMDIMKSSKSDCWGISCGLLRYKLKNIPIAQKVPVEIWEKKTRLKFTKETPDNIRLNKVFENIKTRYSSCIFVEDTLLHYNFEPEIDYSGNQRMYTKNEIRISQLCDYSVPFFLEYYGSNFQYYCKDDKLYFCSARTSKRLWLEWWKSQTQSYKDSLRNNNETIGTYNNRGEKESNKM